MRKLLLIVVSTCLSLLAAGCSTSDPTTPSFVPGPASATGTLKSIELSLTRRGTHVLVVDDAPRWYVESKTVNLREFENSNVLIQGTLEVNRTPEDLPVLVTEHVEKQMQSDLQEWPLASLGIRLLAPSDWTSSEENHTVSFRPAHQEHSLLVLRSITGSSLPPGTPFFIDNRPAVRSLSPGSGIQEIAILDGKRVIILHSDPKASDSPLTESEISDRVSLIQRVVTSISFLDSAKQFSTASGSGSLGQKPCGGEAKLLCDIGHFCDITDAETGLGICRKRKY